MVSSKTSRGVSKAEWLQAAMTAITQGSIAEVTIGGLARDLGIAKSGFYWHFKNREDLLSQLLEYWTHEITEVVTTNEEVLSLNPIERLTRTAEMILDYDLVRYEISIRQWALTDKIAARAVRTVYRKRLEFIRNIFTELGIEGDEAETRAMLFVCYQTWESWTFPEISRKRRRELIANRVALLTRR